MIKKHSDHAQLRDNPVLFKETIGLKLNWDKNYPPPRFLVVISSPYVETLG